MHRRRQWMPFWALIELGIGLPWINIDFPDVLKKFNAPTSDLSPKMDEIGKWHPLFLEFYNKKWLCEIQKSPDRFHTLWILPWLWFYAFRPIWIWEPNLAGSGFQKVSYYIRNNKKVYHTIIVSSRMLPSHPWVDLWSTGGWLCRAGWILVRSSSSSGSCGGSRSSTSCASGSSSLCCGRGTRTFRRRHTAGSLWWRGIHGGQIATGLRPRWTAATTAEWVVTVVTTVVVVDIVVSDTAVVTVVTWCCTGIRCLVFVLRGSVLLTPGIGRPDGCLCRPHATGRGA